jgi:hypothetical protein
MLKLGDKSLMGIIIPSLLVVLLIGVPYIDRNPNRSFVKRPLAVSIGVIFVLALITLSYMGLPQYGIEVPAATRIIQDIAPEEGSGPLHEVPFDQLQQGTYIVNQTPTEDLCPDLDFGCPALEEVFLEYTNAVNEAIESGDLPNGEGIMLIEDWQADLKKVTMRILWDDPESGQDKEYFKHVYLHRNHGSE